MQKKQEKNKKKAMKKINKQVVFLILSNTILFIVSYFLFDWSIYNIYLAYFIESVILLFFMPLRMLTAMMKNPYYSYLSKSDFRRNERAIGQTIAFMLITLLILILVYLAFTSLQAHILLKEFNKMCSLIGAFCFEEDSSIFFFWETTVFSQIGYALILNYSLHYIYFYLFKKEYLKVKLKTDSMFFFKRIATQQMLVILGIWIISKYGYDNIILLLLFVGIRLFVELYLDKEQLLAVEEMEA